MITVFKWKYEYKYKYMYILTLYMKTFEQIRIFSENFIS